MIEPADSHPDGPPSGQDAEPLSVAGDSPAEFSASDFDSPAAPILLETDADASTAGDVDRTPIGPGLRESLFWILGFVLIEVVGGLAWQTGILAYDVGVLGNPPPLTETAAKALIESYLPVVMPWMIGTIKFVEVVAALAAIRLRFGRSAFRATGFRPIRPVHAFVMGLAVLPTAFLAGQSFALFQGYWNRLAKVFPDIKAFEQFSSIETVQQMTDATPVALLVLVIALFPALNEEFVFRAAIGRGLLARYGLIGGVALTSMCFAAVHISPVHVFALLPIAVVMHVAYLSSGSIWGPVGIHFLNNALSVVLMSLAVDAAESTFSPVLFLASGACVAATIWLLMEMRLRWRTADGRLWQPPGWSVEPPPASLNAVPFVSTPSTAVVVTAVVCYALFPFGVLAGLLILM